MKTKTIIIAIIILVIIVIGVLIGKKQPAPTDANEITIGYIVYPPLLTLDANTGELSGVSYDIVNAVSEKLGVTPKWTEEVGWGTAIEGLKTGRYQILGTQMWPNDERSAQVDFTDAPMNSVIYPYVRAGDTRFADLSVLNSDQYTIGAVDGEMAVFIAAEDYPKARMNTLPQSVSYAESLLSLVQKKVDVTFIEPSVANDFLKANPESIMRATENPVRTFGNSFAVPKNNSELLTQWNGAINELINDGTIEKILQKYNVEAAYSINQ